MRSARDGRSFAVPNGQVVYRGRYHFAWRRGHFVGAYDTLDDAVAAVTFQQQGMQKSINEEPPD
jgi:hypothetical protein